MNLAGLFIARIMGERAAAVNDDDRRIDGDEDRRRGPRP